MRLEPTPFRGVTSITPSRDNCARSTSYVGIMCTKPTLLVDDNTGPPQLNFPTDAVTIVAWTNTNNDNNYLVIVPTKLEVITTVTIHVYNNPAMTVGVPNFELYGLSSTVTNIPSGGPLPIDIIGNNQFSQSDQIVRPLTILTRNSGVNRAYLLKWNFNNLRDISWFIISEVSLCNDSPNIYPRITSISFSTPISNITTVTPLSNLHINGSLTLTCTISNEGKYQWTWTQGTNMISDTDPNTSIYSADATRTSVLVIPFPASSKTIRCNAMNTETYNTRTFEVLILSKLFKKIMRENNRIG